MAESGLASAVAMCVESQWRQAPLSVISGTNYKPGVANTSPHRFWTVEAGGGVIGRAEIMTPDNEIDGDIQLVRTIKTGVNYEGSFSFKADGENLYYPLLGILGKDIQTTDQTGGGHTTMYKHVFRPFKWAPTFTFEEIFGSGTYGRLSTGCVIHSLGLDFGAVMTARMGVTPFRQIPNQYINPTNVATDYVYGSTPGLIPRQLNGWLGNGTNTVQVTPPGSITYIDVAQEQPGKTWGNGPFTWASMQNGLQGGNFAAAFVTIDDVPYQVEILEGVSLNIARAIRADMIGGSGFDPGTVTASQVSITGSMRILFNDLNVQLAQLRHSKVAVNFQFVGVQPSALSTQLPYTIDVYLPNVRFTSSEGPNVADGPIIVGGDFVARRDPTTQYSCQITLRNTFDGTQLGGAWPLATTHSGSAMIASTTVTLTPTAVRGFQLGDIIDITSTLGTDRRVITAINYSTPLITFNVAVTQNHAGAGATTVTKVGFGTTLSAIATATASLTVTSNAGFQIGDIISIGGVTGTSLITGFTSTTGITIATAITAASGALVYKSMINAGGTGGYAIV